MDGKLSILVRMAKIATMKKYYLFALLFMALAVSAFAQTRKAIVTVTIKTPAAACEVCKERIESYLKQEPGIQKSVVDIKKKITKVTYYTDRTNIENIKTAIANAGFDADDISANPDAYDRLPKCCKRPDPPGGR